MEELLPVLKDMLKKAITVNKDKSALTITLKVTQKFKRKLADPEEIIIMLKMFGGLKEEIPMDITIDNENQLIDIKLKNEEDFFKLDEIFAKIWDNAVDMLVELLDGNFDAIKDIPRIDD